MRLLHIIDHLGAGGAQRLLADIAPRQQQRGHTVCIICLRGPTPLGVMLASAGVRVHYMRMKRWDARQAPALLALLRAEQPDLVHTHLTLSCLLGRMIAVAAGVRRVVVHDHEADAEAFITPTPLLALKRLLEPYLPPRAIRYIAISRHSLAYACEVRRLPRSRISLVPNGIDLAYLEQGRLTPDEARARLGLPDSAPLIGYAGRLAPEKGVDLLLETLTHLPGAHVAIAGRGPLADRLRARASTLGVERRAHFLGHLDDIRPLYWACDLYAQPSRREAFGLAAAEASASGLPVVATNTGGLRDIILDGRTGWLTPPGNVEALMAALATLLNNPEQARAFGRAGSSYVRQHFAIDTVLDQLDQAYLEAVE